ncbi:MAG: MmgE/PrpD family protein [Halorientalis sp.]
MADDPTAHLAALVAETEYGDLPDDAVRPVERAFVDTVGVTLAGTDEPAARETRTAFTDETGPATVVGTDRRAPADAAALVTATAGHALDFDDVTGEVWHPSVTLVAPALAAGEQVGAAGRDLVTAYAVGYEVEHALGDRLLPGHYERGWHATATLGVFGATAAAASLRELDREAARHAFGIAASMPAGLKANFGTMAKPLHPGLAARSGVTAARLADAGFTAAQDAVAGEGGFLDLYAGDDGPESDGGGRPGDSWAVADGLRVKKYPCCYFTHAAIAATRHLAATHGIAPGDVEALHVGASAAADGALHYSDPETGLEGKFSMHHAVAAALARDRVGLDAFTDAAVADPETAALRERVTFAVDPDLPAESYRATVDVETTDGRRHTHARGPPGTPDDPLPDAALRAKFEDCLAHGPDVAAAEAYEALDSLRDVAAVGDLLATLRPT